MKVYIVMTGRADYGIACVCSDEERAKALAKILDPCDGAVETWDLDAPVLLLPLNGWKRYEAKITLEGDVLELREDTTMPLTLQTGCYHIRDTNTLSVAAWAPDPEHAAKIVNEQRVQWMVRHPDGAAAKP